LLIDGYDLFDNVTQLSKDGLLIIAMTPTIKQVGTDSNEALIGV
jgi:hypothetical protein